MKRDSACEFAATFNEFNRSTLVVIDMQHAFQAETSPWCIPRYASIVPVIQRLRKLFPNRTLHTRFVRDVDEPGAWTAYYDYWRAMRCPPDDPVWHSTLDIDARDLTIAAGTFSKWPQIAPHVPMGHTLIICGVATECCVLSTVLGAIDAGRRVILISDGCAAISDEMQSSTLALAALMFPLCRVVASVQLLRHYDADQKSC